MMGARAHLTRGDSDQDQPARQRGGGRIVTEPHLETDRLELRPLTLGDLDELASMLGDVEALTHWGPPLSREESRAWIERNLRRDEDDGFGRCAVILRSTGELVGDCGLIRTFVEGRPEVELGWIVCAGVDRIALPWEGQAIRHPPLRLFAEARRRGSV